MLRCQWYRTTLSCTALFMVLGMRYVTFDQVVYPCGLQICFRAVQVHMLNYPVVSYGLLTHMSVFSINISGCLPIALSCHTSSLKLCKCIGGSTCSLTYIHHQGVQSVKGCSTSGLPDDINGSGDDSDSQQSHHCRCFPCFQVSQCDANN